MVFSAIATFVLALGLMTPSLAAPAPAPVPQDTTPAPADSSFWMGSIERIGKPAFGSGDYTIFRNVKDFGAVGDGVTDDTVAINLAITNGNRCGNGCDSSTTTPAVVYFPAGTYKVSSPIIMYYYTQMLGDANSLPTLLAAPEFEGMAVLDADPYNNDGSNWFTNQNNFFRQVRNFVIDLRQMPMDRGAGIHWQVAQATSLQNIRFEMHVDQSENNKQLGIFQDNGSGGFMTDLTFNGGQYGAFLGSQQFTTRNLTFNGCRTAVFMNWNWGWSLHGLNINNCGVGVDMANGGDFQTVGSVLLLDSVIANTPIGVATAYNTASAFTNGSLIIENTDMSQNVPTAVANTINPEAPVTVLAGNQMVDSFVQGRVYDTAGAAQAVQGPSTPITKPAGLLGADGKVFTRSKPQYENLPVSAFVSVKKAGAVGDGVTDDSDIIQQVFDAATLDQVVYFDHGAYLVTKTINVPKNIRIVGEFWPLILAGGSTTFKDENNPQPMLRVGQAGDVGTVEISDIIIETAGAQPGAILMEWNVKAETAGSTGLWDTHFRIGGSAGTQLQSDKCSKTPDQTTTANPECVGAFLLLHITASGSCYLENDWFWVSDHELDLGDHNQINIYNGRGVLVESTEPTWFWGTASEHSVLYNYQITNAKNVWLSMIQTETAYFQGNPDARTPFAIQEKYSDPNWDTLCAGSGENCARTLGFRVTSSSDVFLYGGGLYSFFNNYDQECLKTADCQQDMVYIEQSTGVHMLGISTKAAVNMLKLDNQPIALDADNRNNFCAMIAMFQTA